MLNLRLRVYEQFKYHGSSPLKTGPLKSPKGVHWILRDVHISWGPLRENRPSKVWDSSPLGVFIEVQISWDRLGERRRFKVCEGN